MNTFFFLTERSFDTFWRIKCNLSDDLCSIRFALRTNLCKTFLLDFAVQIVWHVPCTAFQIKKWKCLTCKTSKISFYSLMGALHISHTR